MVMDMGLVDVSADDKGVFPFGEPHRQIIAQAVGLFRGNLAGNEGLPYLVGQHIVRSPVPAGLGDILPLCKKKFSVCDPAVALVAGDKPAAVCLSWVLYIVQDVADRRPCRPALSGMQRHQAGGGDRKIPPSNKKRPASCRPFSVLSVNVVLYQEPHLAARSAPKRLISCSSCSDTSRL